MTYNTNNQVNWTSAIGTGFTYDGGGNVLSDALNGYAYDGEGRLCAVKNFNSSYTQYIYNAEGTRVAKGSGSVLSCAGPGTGFTLQSQYLLGLGGEQVTELDGGGNWVHTNVWGGGRILATYNSAGIHFPLTDPLGSKRVQANYAGLTDETCFELPWGNGLYCSGADATEHHFTAKERDSESGNDYFDARYYSSAMGRFMSPDEPKFSEKTDPQSWNLYSYVGNNPLVKTDPSGHNWFDINGQWQWHKGSDYSWTDSAGNSQSSHSDYTNLIVYSETSQNGKTTNGTLTLYGNDGGFTKSNIMAQDTVAFSGGAEGRGSVVLGNYEMNLNRHGGVNTNVLAGTFSTGFTLGSFHNGIQNIGTIDIGGGGTASFTSQWGDFRANLIPLQGQPTDQYIHGKGLYFTEGLSVTHGCIATPYQNVLKTLFKIDPSGVGEGAKTGRIAVSVEGK